MKFLEVEKLVEKFVRAHSELVRTVDFVVGVSRGGLIPAALLAARIDKPLVTAYIDKKDRVYLDRGVWIRGQRLLVVDDIVRTGTTLAKILALVRKSGAREVKSFALFCLRTARLRPTWTTLLGRDKKMPWDFPNQSF